MEAASPKIILERLKEEWIEVADASVYRELELEKQLWMLSALKTLKKPSEMSVEESNTPSRFARALSLYENHGKLPASSANPSTLILRPSIGIFSFCAGTLC